MSAVRTRIVVLDDLTADQRALVEALLRQGKQKGRP
jgi:hypothetical protein